MKKLILTAIAALGLFAQNPVVRELTCSDAGASDTYACSFTVAPAAYVTGLHYRFKANTANTGAASINFNSLGAKTIKKAPGGVTTDLDTNDIRAGQWVDLVYDGTNMQMQSTLGNASAGAGGGTFFIASSNGYMDLSSSTKYLSIAQADGSSQGNVWWFAPSGMTCTASNFTVYQGTGPAANVTWTLRDATGAADTAITVTITTGTTGFISDTAHSVSLTPANAYTWKVVSSGANAGFMQWALKVTCS